MQCCEACRSKPGDSARGQSAPEARDGLSEVTVVVEVSVKVTAMMPVYFTSQSQLWLCPSFHPRRRRWNVTKLNCSQPSFAATVRHCLGLLSSFQSFSPFSSQAVPPKSPFGSANMCVSVCVCWSIVPFTEFSDAHWPIASQTLGLWGCLTVVIYPDPRPLGALPALLRWIFSQDRALSPLQIASYMKGQCRSFPAS